MYSHNIIDLDTMKEFEYKYQENKEYLERKSKNRHDDMEL